MKNIGPTYLFFSGYCFQPSTQTNAGKPNRSFEKPNYRRFSLPCCWRTIRGLVLGLLLLAVFVGRIYAATVVPATAVPSGGAFGTVTVGTTDTLSVQLRNNGTTDFTITKVTVNGSSFQFSGLDTPHLVHAGRYHTFYIKYSPSAAVTNGGSVFVETTAANGTVKIYLSGTGVTSARTLSVSPASLTFSKEAIGTSESLAVTLKNTGNASVTVSGISVSNSQLGTSGSVNGATLAAGQTATLNVIYTPTTAGSFSGQVKVSSNANNSPGTISVTGTAFTQTTAPSVKLNWDASTSTGIAGYFVYRSTTSGAGFAKLESTASSGLTYTDDAVAHGTTYYYEVSAVSSTGVESAKCPQTSVSVP
jgi:hypothetical protein